LVRKGIREDFTNSKSKPAAAARFWWVCTFDLDKKMFKRILTTANSSSSLFSFKIRQHRLFSSVENEKSKSNSRGLLSRALIAGGLAAPLGFGYYKWQYDPEFKRTIQETFSPKKPANIQKSLQVPSTPAQTTTSTFLPPASNPPPTPAGTELPAVKVETSEPAEEEEKISLEEIEQLEKGLLKQEEVEDGTTSVTFSKDEVKNVQNKIEQAENAAEDRAKDEPATANFAVKEEEPKTIVSSSTSSEKQQQQQPEPHSVVEAIRDAAKKVEKAAVEASKSEIAKVEAQLKADIEKVLSKDLSSLNIEGLRERVVQLTLELKDRNKWEAIRLHEVITKTIEDLSQKYLVKMKEQEAAFENLVRVEVANAAMEAAASTEERLSKSLQERLAKQREALRAEMELNIERAREDERHAADTERKARTEILHEMEKRLNTFDEALRDRDNSRLDLARSKRAILAALKFTQAALLEETAPQQVEQCLSELRVASAGDPIITEALDALPHRVFASGVPSTHRLAKAFEKDVKPDILQASLIPENASLLQQALAKATTALLITGKPSVSPAPEDDSIESKCGRILIHLDQEDLVSALAEAEKIPKQVQERSANFKDWLAQVQDRLRVEAALRLLTARFEDS
jgi:hypothetical protein